MKASQFIQVAMIDQMQQIADLGLWYHLVTLLGKGANTLLHVVGNNVLIHWGLFGNKYNKFPGPGIRWEYAEKPEFLFCSDPDDATLNATFSETGSYYIHVPTFFEDFKTACKEVLRRIDAGEIEDIEIVKITE